jgi:5'-nucleotidase
MNPGGIRANVDAGAITHGEAFAIQPFSNIVVTKTLTGAQIDTVLEQQFVNVAFGAPPTTVTGSARTLILQVSAGFTYTWDATAAAGSKVDPTSIKLNGVTLNPAGLYRVTMNNFLGGGGDNFPAFTLGTNEVQGLDDLVALENYLAGHNPYVPPTDQRIKRLN